MRKIESYRKTGATTILRRHSVDARGKSNSVAIGRFVIDVILHYQAMIPVGEGVDDYSMIDIAPKRSEDPERAASDRKSRLDKTGTEFLTLRGTQRVEFRALRYGEQQRRGSACTSGRREEGRVVVRSRNDGNSREMTSG